MESHRCKGTKVSSRWNPTKEQINILENLYERGIRTPSADQIQDITATLSAYSHIEGKNVFYWFQNHKARQRQRQKHKQESLAYLNRFLYSSHSILSPPLCPDVICAPYQLPQSEISYNNPQRSKVFVPRPMQLPTNCDGPQAREDTQQRVPENLRTLTLFPLHPTGILEGQTRALLSADTSITTSDDSSDVDEERGRPGKQAFFDFFSLGQGSQTQ